MSFWIFSDQFNRITIAGWPSECKKHINTHISNLAALATPLLLDWSMMRNIYNLQIFTVWSYKPSKHSPLGTLFQCCLKKNKQKIQKIQDLTFGTAQLFLRRIFATHPYAFPPYRPLSVLPRCNWNPTCGTFTTTFR